MHTINGKHTSLNLIRASHSTVPALRGKRLPPLKQEKRMKRTRKSGPYIAVWCSPEEKKLIETNATQHGLSASSFLRNVGLGIKVSGVLDQNAIGELAKINADLGRLGGLLKMWLTNDERLALYNKAQLAQTIFGTLEKINTIQDVLLEKAKSM